MENLPEGIEVEDDGAVRFSGRARWLLLAVLKRAKFAGDYESIALFNPWMASLAAHLTAELAPDSELQPYADDGATRYSIARAIAYDADNMGWWKMTDAERADFLQSVVAAPHVMSQETVEEILLAVTDVVENARRMVNAASAAP
ncbi:hypothetical protein [Brevundimonas sp. NIBR11]|uniref:hypothetical protein n=1 Tax=Brevundimonas sp. NIBR11 TaxID=3015999 RepID=UPI0022F04CC9|nr:hypothetical protein [Brevundimonas sp. NIBR11]WGM31382.1 hypothetical protein KKHFBJBL_01626 [Brevundimonas sp. NIBR11]